MPIRFLLIVSAAAALCACGGAESGQTEDAPEPAVPVDDAAGEPTWIDDVAEEAAQVLASQDWIEVDLADGVFHAPVSDYRSDVVAIDVPAGGALEYKLAMEEGDTIVYSWRVREISVPALLLSEFHGHTEPEPGRPGTVMFYRKLAAAKHSGALVAPFSGVHGWYLENLSDEPVVIDLDVAGFYELIPNQ